MNFAIYMVGVILVVIALAYGLHLAGLNSTWIAIGALVVIGLGIMAGVAKTRSKDPS